MPKSLKPSRAKPPKCAGQTAPGRWSISSGPETQVGAVGNHKVQGFRVEDLAFFV